MKARTLLALLSANVLLACTTPAPSDGGDANSDGALRDGTFADMGTCIDEDNDGHPSAACGGDDCDDRNARVNPGIREVCDNLGVDEDCDPCTVAQVLPAGRGGDGDQDEDGFASTQCFNRVTAATTPVCASSVTTDGGARVERVRVSAAEVRGTDCNDDAANGATRFPGATEQCNNVDDNCDGMIDEGVSVQCFPDVDGDGFAPAGSTQSRACPSADPGRVRDFGACPPGTTNRAPAMGASDCNDGMGGNSVFPGATEVCNNADDNCDGVIDEGDPGAGASCMLMSMGSDPGVCRTEARIRCVGGALQCAQGVRPGERLEMCNSLDDDCDGVADEALCVDSTIDALGRQSAPTGFGSCAGAVCTITACADGRGDCNAQTSDGCEADLSSNANHCGACGARCPFGAACVQGACERQTFTAVRTGAFFSCMLHTDGRVFCWGANEAQQLGDGTMVDRADPVAVSGLSDAVEISLGGIHACARRRSGEVWCWGSNATGRLGDGSGASSGVPVRVSGVTDAVEISLGHAHGCARRATGAVVCWGLNSTGQLGDRSTMNRATPVAVASITNAVSISAGWDHSCAVTGTGTVFCWGGNSVGQLGNGATSTMQTAPVQVSAIANAREVRVGDHFSCARLATNAVSCWGENGNGQLGNGTLTDRSAPSAVSALNNAVELTVGARHACVRRADATVACWGDNAQRQLGNGGTTQSSAPVAAIGVRNAVEVATRYSHTCVRRATGGVSCWGTNGNGQLGNDIPAGSADRVGVTATNMIAQIVGGESHGCARRATGEVLCWGANSSGQLGDRTMTTRLEPVLAAGIDGAIDLAVGQSHTCALRRDRTVWCWGANSSGQLGDGTTTLRNEATQVMGITDAVQLTAGLQHTCARRANGAVVCWGSNAQGQLGDGAMMDRAAPVVVPMVSGALGVTAGHQHTCARRNTGEVLCWGSNSDGQLGDGTRASRPTAAAVAALSGVIELSAGRAHTCARLHNGTLQCWGDNSLGQLGNNSVTPSLTPVMATVVPPSTRFVAITSGATSNCARSTSNAMYCWGDNTHGQLAERSAAIRTTPSVLMIVPAPQVGVYSGQFSHFARASLGPVRAWGEGAAGQLADGTMLRQYLPVNTVGLND